MKLLNTLRTLGFIKIMQGNWPSAADEETVAMLKEGNAVRGCPLIVLPTGLINSMLSKVSVYYGLCGSWAMRA